MAEQNEKIKKVVLRNAPENHQMVAPEIQKDIANCFAEVNLFIYYIFLLRSNFKDDKYFFMNRS
jgi:hypothetical protein